MTILLVDDSKAIRTLVARLILGLLPDARILHAENVREGIEVARASRPDVVISDWHMPDKNGLEFLTALRAEGIAVTFGLLTSDTTAASRSAALEAGAVFVLNKPFTHEELKATLRRLFPH